MNVYFDYQRDPLHPFVERISSVRIPPRYLRAVTACATAVCIVIGSYVIERVRLAETERLVIASQQRYESVKQRLEQARVAQEQLEQLARLDQRLRTIDGSGEREAVRLSDLARELPSRTWLVRITPEGDDATIVARTFGLDDVAETLRVLNGGRFGKLDLDRATRVDEQNRTPLIEFSLRMHGSSS